MISGQQRAYGELYAKSIALDKLYADTVYVTKPTRQMIRADARAAKKELLLITKKQARKSKRHRSKDVE